MLKKTKFKIVTTKLSFSGITDTLNSTREVQLLDMLGRSFVELYEGELNSKELR